jgi:hypothetical protein
MNTIRTEVTAQDAGRVAVIGSGTMDLGLAPVFAFGGRLGACSKGEEGPVNSSPGTIIIAAELCLEPATPDEAGTSLDVDGQ